MIEKAIGLSALVATGFIKTISYFPRLAVISNMVVGTVMQTNHMTDAEITAAATTQETAIVETKDGIRLYSTDNKTKVYQDVEKTEDGSLILYGERKRAPSNHNTQYGKLDIGDLVFGLNENYPTVLSKGGKSYIFYKRKIGKNTIIKYREIEKKISISIRGESESLSLSEERNYKQQHKQ